MRPYIAPLLLMTLIFLVVPATRGQDPASVVTEDTQIGAWLVRCVQGEEVAQGCFMATTAINALEQRELAVMQVIRVDEWERQGEEEFAAQLTSPTNVNVRVGIDLQVDQSLLDTVPYEICTVNNCITTFAITPEMQSALEQGFAAALIFTDVGGQRISATLSLDGFARGLEAL